MTVHLAIHAPGAALGYSAGLLAGELLLCMTSKYGCQLRGDLAAALMVMAGLFGVLTVLLGFYLFMLRRIASSPGVGTRLRRTPALVFLSSVAYGVAIVLLFFATTGNLASFFLTHGFWIHALVGSVFFGGYVVLLFPLGRSLVTEDP